MSSEFSRDHLKIALAKILQTIGWHSINTTPLEVLADILCIFITRVSKTTASYANEFGQTIPNLDHLALAFREHDVSLQELEEYVSFVNFAQGPAPVPKYPLPKENHLNFLKPGSKEVVTRPVHIHEHLPPMHSLTEEVNEENDPAITKQEVSEETIQENIQIFKRPIDISPSEFKRSNLRREEDLSRPTREISSVMMTTSGFLSPAREGRLPESRTPAPPPPEPQLPPSEPPQPIAAQVPMPAGQPIVPPPGGQPAPAPQSKRPKVARKSQKGKKEKVGRELFKATGKEGAKIKKGMVHAALANGLEVIPSQVPMIPKHVSQNKANKALAAARLKTEKLNTTITPIPIKQNIAEVPGPSMDVDKLFTEPNKKKLNILKKISNVKDSKLNASNKKEDKMDTGLVISEGNDVTCKLKSIPCDLTIEPINAPLTVKMKQEPRDFSMFKINSHAASKTDMLQMSANGKPKRKRKPRAPKQKLQLGSDMGLDMSQPKVPEPSMLMPKQEPGVFPPLGSQIPPLPLSYPFLQPFGGPGLIPSLIPSNPIFPFNINPMRYLPPPKMPFVRNPLAQSMFKPPPGDELHITMEKTTSQQSHAQVSPKATHHQDDYIKNEPSPVGLMIDEEPLEMTSTSKPLGEAVRAEIKQDANYDQVSSTNTAVQDSGCDVLPSTSLITTEKKSKEHKKDKKDRLKKKNKKDKMKSKADKAEKKKLKEGKRDKEKLKKEKKEKRKELQQQMKVTESLVPKITLKIGSPPRSATPEMKKLNIKPVVRRDDEPSSIPSWEERKREPSPGLAKISALVTGPPKPKNTTIAPAYNSIPSTSHDNNPKRLKPIPKIRAKELIREPILEIASTPPSKYVDAEGNEVWICPACGRQDDGSPMIGCDDCDAWYHWVCVGIQVPPDENENWYCRHCLMKKDEDLQGDKKKKRKKRDKKDN